MLGRTSSGSDRFARGTHTIPSVKRSAARSCGLECEPSLARAARAGQREQSKSSWARSSLSSCDSRSRPTNELAGRGRFVFVDRPQRREGALPELIEARRAREVLEAVLAELGQRVRRFEQQRRSSWERTTWPPWPAVMIRAARWTSMPTYLGGSRPGSPVWIPTRMRIGPPSSASSSRRRRPTPAPRRRRRRRMRPPRSRPRILVAGAGVPDDRRDAGRAPPVGARPELLEEPVEPSMSVKTMVTVPEGCRSAFIRPRSCVVLR